MLVFVPSSRTEQQQTSSGGVELVKVYEKPVAPLYEGLRTKSPDFRDPRVLNFDEFGKVRDGWAISARAVGLVAWRVIRLHEIGELHLAPAHRITDPNDWPADDDARMDGVMRGDVLPKLARHLATTTERVLRELNWVDATEEFLVKMWGRYGAEITSHLNELQDKLTLDAQKLEVPGVLRGELTIGVKRRVDAILPPTQAGYQDFLAMARVSDERYDALKRCARYWWGRGVPYDLLSGATDEQKAARAALQKAKKKAEGKAGPESADGAPAADAPAPSATAPEAAPKPPSWVVVRPPPKPAPSPEEPEEPKEPEEPEEPQGLQAPAGAPMPLETPRLRAFFELLGDEQAARQADALVRERPLGWQRDWTQIGLLRDALTTLLSKKFAGNRGVVGQGFIGDQALKVAEWFPEEPAAAEEPEAAALVRAAGRIVHFTLPPESLHTLLRGHPENRAALRAIEWSDDEDRVVTPALTPEEAAGVRGVILSGEGASEVDASDDYVFGVTKAPVAYDGFGTLTLGVSENGERRIAIRKDHRGWQEGRYSSGLQWFRAEPDAPEQPAGNRVSAGWGREQLAAASAAAKRTGFGAFVFDPSKPMPQETPAARGPSPQAAPARAGAGTRLAELSTVQRAAVRRFLPWAMQGDTLVVPDVETAIRQLKAVVSSSRVVSTGTLMDALHEVIALLEDQAETRGPRQKRAETVERAPLAASQESRASRLSQAALENVRVSVLDLSKVANVARAAIADGRSDADVRAALDAFIATIRQDRPVAAGAPQRTPSEEVRQPGEPDATPAPEGQRTDENHRRAQDAHSPLRRRPVRRQPSPPHPRRRAREPAQGHGWGRVLRGDPSRRDRVRQDAGRAIPEPVRPVASALRRREGVGGGAGCAGPRRPCAGASSSSCGGPAGTCRATERGVQEARPRRVGDRGRGARSDSGGEAQGRDAEGKGQGRGRQQGHRSRPEQQGAARYALLDQRRGAVSRKFEAVEAAGEFRFERRVPGNLWWAARQVREASAAPSGGIAAPPRGSDEPRAAGRRR